MGTVEADRIFAKPIRNLDLIYDGAGVEPFK